MFKKKKSDLSNINAGNLTDESFMNNLFQHDDGYKILEKLPTSPAYWFKEGKKIKSMISQLGLPNFFITLSSAETKWINLIKSLKIVSNGVNISDDEAIAMSFSEKSELIKNDPVTCARYFDHIL